jgi:hypothetical protein
VYRDNEYLQRPEKGAPHMETREAFREQVLNGMPMGQGWYLRTFPVWFARKGNFGILLSQAKALSAAGQLRHDKASEDLAQRQAQWIAGRNPFVQSTMYGEGYDWAQQYSVSSGDFVGSLPVGMQSYGNTDLPYWPSQNTYVYKEVWVHPPARWLWLMEDLTDPTVAHAQPANVLDYSVSSTTGSNGRVTVTIRANGTGRHNFTLHADNLDVSQPTKTLTLQKARAGMIQFTGKPSSDKSPWVVVVIPDRDVSNRRETMSQRPMQ